METTTLTFRHYDFSNGYQTMKADLKDITEFSIINRRIYTKKGSFSTFRKDARILIAGKRYLVAPSDVIDIKKALKPYMKATLKDTISEWKRTRKGSSERKATDWIWAIEVTQK